MKTDISEDRVNMQQDYQDLYDRAKKIVVKKDACMKFFNAAIPLYPETDASGVGLGVG